MLLVDTRQGKWKVENSMNDVDSPEIPRRMYPVKKDFISEEDLKETERLLENVKLSESKTTLHYEAWVKQREKSIESIGRLEKKLENFHRTCNVATGVGSAMQAAGSLAMVAGFILSAYGHKNVGEFLTKKVSPVSIGTGVATATSSSLAEIGLTHETMKEVKMVLERDEECTKLLVENLKYSRKIDSHLRRIFNCSILSNNFLNIVILVREGISLLQVGYEAFSELIDEIKLGEVLNELKLNASKCVDISELTETVLQNVYTTMKKISNDPEVRKSLTNICDIIQQSPSAFEFVKLGLRVSFQICDILKVDFITSLLGPCILKSTAGVIATKCLLGAVLIAINVFSVISAVQDAKTGTSKYSKMLKELKMALAMELNTFNNSYMHPKLL